MGSPQLKKSLTPDRFPKEIFWSFVSVMLLAFALRFAIGWTWLDRLSADPDAYAAIAMSLSQTGVFGLSDGAGHGIPSAFRPPLYPWLLSFFVDDAGTLNLKLVAVFHSLLGAFTVALAWDFSRRVLKTFASRRTDMPSDDSQASIAIGQTAGPWLTAGIVAIDPLLVWQSTVVMTETLATLLTVAASWLWCILAMKPRHECSTSTKDSLGWIAGVASLAAIMGLAYLCRPTFLVWGVLTTPLLWWIGSQCRIRRSSLILIHALLLSAVVGLWTMRNFAVMGQPIWATTHGGYTLLLANNESFYEHVRAGGLPFFRQPWNPDQFFERHAHRFEGDVESAEFWLTNDQSSPLPMPPPSWGEIDDDRLTQRAAMATIQRGLPTFLKSCVYRLASLWNPIPNVVEGRAGWQIILASIFGICLTVGGIVALVRHGRWCLTKPFWPMWTLALALSLVHSVYFSNPRMRAPIQPMLAILAVSSILPNKRYDA